MPQKRGEVVEKSDAGQSVPDVYEDWIKKQVKVRAGTLAEGDEEEIDRAEDQHEKAHRRKRGRGAAASNS